jgi:hypothetical protein
MAALHGRRPGARRSYSRRRYVAWFSIPRALGERGDRRESTPSLGVAGNLHYMAADSGAIAGPDGAHGDGPRERQTAREKAEKG